MCQACLRCVRSVCLCMCGVWEICTAAEAVEAQMVETAVLIYVCLHKSVRQGDSEREREREEK